MEDKSAGAEAGASPRATDKASSSARPSSALGPVHKESILEPDSLNLVLGLPHKGSGPSLECSRPQQTLGQTSIANILGLEGVVGFGQ
ncbi:hypothetical protein J1N35_007892 [Gossypium stocksii]|uniref:Uncharacterized protein n=1 Tax=Gossypium stocksii TaxID=47602 RepID=A0A9D3W776_9ROSI|nr:hypothetical protein J1N35_007892 [Gossypium stocksii]